MRWPRCWTCIRRYRQPCSAFRTSRWYEILNVYGETIKEMIHEKFGDGIMSAIDFTMNIDKQEDPKGDRVVVILSGKFLPYKAW